MWKPEHRRAADRHGLRYPSDLIDSEWALIERAIPPAKRGGRRREVNVREVLNAIFYVLSTGCQWQALPKDLPPKSTAHADSGDVARKRPSRQSVLRPSRASRCRWTGRSSDAAVTGCRYLSRCWAGAGRL